ncbi:trypsin-like peptidase domain-containing protein [Phocaeicola sp.]|uniref:trypsin-like peptidase domain-containing protein n=1 Tax=Phocaeicola sp. TaxID=2773926 RepID=UPI003FA0C836
MRRNMRKVLLLLLCCMGISSYAQTPKWVDKAKKAVFSVITYDEKNNIKGNGNGFYIGEDGIALSDYTLFDGAQRAVIVNSKGKEMNVSCIAGANQIYDVLKFKTEIDGNVEFLQPATVAGKVGEIVYLLPYSTQKNAEVQTGKITAVDSIGQDGFYYTLAMKTPAKMVSCPIMNANGQVLGMIQRNASEEDTSSFAIGASFGASLHITAVSAAHEAYTKIGIKKALPDTEEQALIYLYMISSGDQDIYTTALEDFLAKFPNSYEGYIRRAAKKIDSGKQESWPEAQADIDKALEVANDKNEAKYNIAKMFYNYSLSKEEGQGNPDWSFSKALEMIKEVILTDSQPIYAQLEGDINYAMKDYQAAFDSYQKVNQSNLASAASFYSAAHALQNMEGSDRQQILSLLDNAVDKCIVPYTSDAAPYLFARGQQKADMKDYRGAVKDFDETYRAYNGNVNANFFFQREQAEVNLKMYQQAIDDINRATELVPDSPDVWLEKGALHIRVNQIEEALTALQKTIELNQKMGAAYRMIGYCQVQKKQNKEACANFNKAKELGDTAVETLIQKYCK